ATGRTGTGERSTIRAAGRSSQGAGVVVVREPIVGWRQWDFMSQHFLANLGTEARYVPREKIEARCEQSPPSEQRAPHLTCMCGIYAYKEKPRLLREIGTIYRGHRLVYGEINLWGKVIEHEDGY